MPDKLLQIMQTLPEFLTQNYLDWQAAQGEIRTLEEYAEYLGVNRSLLSFWMNGKRVPSEENIDKMSLQLGNEIYDVLNIPRLHPPNPHRHHRHRQSRPHRQTHRRPRGLLPHRQRKKKA